MNECDYPRPHEPGRAAPSVVAEARLADELGLDVYGLGEHHRTDVVASAPGIVLAANAGAIRRVKLSSAVAPS